MKKRSLLRKHQRAAPFTGEEQMDAHIHSQGMTLRAEALEIFFSVIIHMHNS